VCAPPVRVRGRLARVEKLCPLSCCLDKEALTRSRLERLCITVPLRVLYATSAEARMKHGTGAQQFLYSLMDASHSG
jgi:hypothetical protein